MNLLDSVKGVLTNAVVDKASDVLGIENSMMKGAMKMFLPAIIGGVISKGSSESGAGGLIDLFKKGGFGDDNLGDLAGVLGNEQSRGGMLETGADLLGTIFGGNKSGLLDMLLSATGLKKSAGSSLLSFLAPIVINKLAGMVFKNKMGAADLSSYLNDQKGGIMGMVPGLSSLLGGSGASTNLSSNSRAATTSNSEGGGMGWMKYLLPLLLLGGLAFWWSTKDKTVETPKVDTSAETTKVNVNTNTNTTSNRNVTAKSSSDAVKVTTSTSKGTASASTGYTMNANGDLLNPSGAVAFASGSYSLDGTGNLVSKDGKIIMSAASIPGDLMAKLKSALGKLTSGATLDQMKSMFGDMIIKKAGAKSTYGLSQIEFNKENHKISNFSKNEVMGLAEALKANADGKVEVHVYTGDAGNTKLSETRANVIRDMLVTLGVNKKQISAIGKGSSDAAKAASEKVDIVIK